MITRKEEGNRIVLEPDIENPVEKCFGKYSTRISLTEVLLQERKEERKREEEKIFRF